MNGGGNGVGYGGGLWVIGGGCGRYLDMEGGLGAQEIWLDVMGGLGGVGWWMVVDRW